MPLAHVWGVPVEELLALAPALSLAAGLAVTATRRRIGPLRCRKGPPRAGSG